MASIRSTRILLASAALAAITLGAAGSAQARSDVYWSVGIGAPGAQVVLGNAAPRVYVAPQPVYVQPRPVYYPQPVYVQPRAVYVQAPPVYVQPRVWVQPGYYGHYHHGPYGRGWYR